MKAIIIDDEAAARRVIKNMLNSCAPHIEIVGLYENVPDAVVGINRHSPDVVFCDIDMPDYSGIELLSFFQEVDFEIIFVTGYSEYAVQAFEVSAVDYLLKPVQMEKLKRAIEKLNSKASHSMQQKLNTLSTNLSSTEIQKIALPNLEGLQFVNVDEISLLEADGAYTNVYFADASRIVVSKKLKLFEDLLSNRRTFFRVHRSSIVNLNHIKHYSKVDSYIYLNNDKSVKIARDKKAHFEMYIKNIRV